MILLQKVIFGILVSISIVGMIGIPMGDPKFLTNAILLESSFIALAAISIWRLQYSVIPNIVIAIIVIVGGYILQGLLFVTSAIALKKRKQLATQTR